METEEWPALSVVHLDGGLYAVSQADMLTVTIFGGAEKNAAHIFQIRSYQDLYGDLYKLGVLPLGVVFYYHQKQVDGIDPPTSRHVFNLKGRGLSPAEAAAHTWSQIGHAAFSRKDIPLMDLCHRITFELRACVTKWFDIASAYSRTLSGLIREGIFRDGQRFDNGNCFFIHLGIHSLFAELATLRDYLAEVIAQYVLGSQFKHSGAYISKMATLANELRKAKIEHPLVPVIRGLTDDQSGWLAEMSAYRNLLIHHAPVSMAEGRAFTMHRAIALRDGVTLLPAVAFYLPAKPHDIKRARARGGQFMTFEGWAAASTQRSPEEELEALRYCHRLVGRMADLAMAVADYSPVRPTMMTIGGPT